jgi:hypothetical protein
MKANRAIWAAVTVSIALVGTALVACGPTTDDGLLGGVNGNGNGNGGSGWGPGGGGGPTYTGGPDGGGVQAAVAEKLYRDVEAQLKMRCGNACHETGVNAKMYTWLAGPDSYVSIKKYPGIVVDDIYASKLENHPQNHPTQSLVGPGTAPDPMLLDSVTKWLGAEAAALQNAPLPTTDPVDPTAGSVDLTKAGLAGGKITWTAQDLGNGLMRFSNVMLVAPANSGAHAIAPLFVQVPTMGAEVHDLTNSTVDLTVGAGQSGSVVALLYFYNWKAGSKLRIEFQKIETAMVADGGMSGCKDVATFQNSAAPQLVNMCVSCHGGANQTAQNAMDLKALTGQVNYATACVQAHNKINFNNKAQSPIIVTPVQKLNNHPFQVAGGNVTTYTNAMTTWINKE